MLPTFGPIFPTLAEWARRGLLPTLDDTSAFLADMEAGTDCVWTSAEECAMAGERAVAGTSDTPPTCPVHKCAHRDVDVKTTDSGADYLVCDNCGEELRGPLSSDWRI
jgi:hypothetical protein